jgi:hypothetical protein
MRLVGDNRKVLIKALIVGAAGLGVVVALAFALVSVIPPGSSQAEDTFQTPPGYVAPMDESAASAVDVGQIAGELRSAGIDVKDVAVEGSTMYVALESPEVTVDNAIELAVHSMEVRRIAARAGMTLLRWVSGAGDEQRSGDQRVAPLQTVPHVSPTEALAAVDSWVKEVAAKHGVQAEYVLADYRVDLRIAGSTEALESATEEFLMSAFALHDKGYLDLVTVIAESETGNVLFEGVTDCLVSAISHAYAASGFDDSGF